MAALADIPIRLKTPADYRQMTYQQLLSSLNDLNAIERFLPAETYRRHRALVGSLMQNMQRRACMQAYADQITASENHIAELEALLAGR